MKFTFAPESKPLDGYTIKRAIHRGGFGEVYYALSDAGKEVALKLLQQNLEIELRGVTQCMNLKHPNLVTIFDIRQDGDGDHWIVMEYVHGKSLDKIIDEHNGPMPIEEVEQWLAGMVSGLSFLHDRGIVHRDLKPANVFSENNVVKIGDVGLAKFITQSKRSAQTESVGTVYYMAPEVARGRYGHEVDVYSLGIVLYEMLTGRVPFDGESTAEILMKHLSDKPDLSPVPKRLRPVLANALEKDPLKRTATAEQLLSEFRKAIAGVEIPTTLPDDSFAAVEVNVVKEPKTEPPRSRPRKILDHVLETLDRKAKRHARIAERKAARHARKMERKAARHAQKLERQAAKHARKMDQSFDDADDDSGVVVAAAAPPPLQGTHALGSNARRSNEHSRQISQGLKVGAIILIVLAVVMPRSFWFLMHTLFKVAILGGIGYGIYWVFSKLTAPHSSSAPAGAGYRVTSPRNVPVVDLETPHSRQASPQPVARNQPHPVGRRLNAPPLTPDTPRTISLRTRVSELTGSLSFAVLFTAVITAVVAILSPVVQSPSRIALFAAVSLLASWAVLLTSKWYEGTRVRSGHRRLMTTLFGVLIGVVAFLCHQFLFVQFTTADYNLHDRGLVHTIGTINLTEMMQPTLFGYVIFFAGLFALRHWWRHGDSLRRRRVAIGSVLLTTFAGLVWSLVMTFPVMWGVTWAASISCIVQLSATWMPLEERRRLAEGRHAR